MTFSLFMTIYLAGVPVWLLASALMTRYDSASQKEQTVSNDAQAALGWSTALWPLAILAATLVGTCWAGSRLWLMIAFPKDKTIDNTQKESEQAYR